MGKDIKDADDYIRTKSLWYIDFKSKAKIEVIPFGELDYSNEHYERGIYIEHRLIGFVNDVKIADGVIELGYVTNYGIGI